jgi:hypothetical protein
MSTGVHRIAVAMIVVTSGGALFAQSNKADKSLPIRESVADAEAEGAAYPHGAAPEHPPKGFAARPPGTSERKCINGPATDLGFQPMMQIRSGDFIIGGQVGVGMPASAGRQSKIWWAPYHNPETYGTTLLVRGAHLGVPGDTFRYEQLHDAWPAPAFGRVQTTSDSERKRDSFFPSGITIPHAGRWLLVATAGDDWGCFILPAA